MIDDMSAGELDARIELPKTNIALKEYQHRQNLQITVSNSALTFVALLFIVAAVFGGCLLFLLVTRDKTDIHWHASILVGAFVVPPTVVLVALLRAVYTSKDEDKAQSAIPVLSMIKEIVATVAGIFKKA